MNGLSVRIEPVRSDAHRNAVQIDQVGERIGQNGSRNVELIENIVELH